MPKLSDALRLPLTRRFQQSLLTITDNTARPIQKMWAGLENHDESSIDTLAARAATITTNAKAIAMRQSLGYYTTLAGARPVPIKPAEIDTEAQFRDPFISYWLGLKNGHPANIALALGASRVVDMVSNLINGTARETAGVVAEKAGLVVVSWERIAESDACPFCEDLAADEYDSADAAGFTAHDRCGCVSAPRF